MKMCQTHWNTLRVKIDEAGLRHLVSQDGAEAAAKLVMQIQEGDVPESRDPLMDAHWAIMNNGLQYISDVIGVETVMAVMQDQGPHSDEDSRGCPICVFNYICDQHEKECTEPGCSKPPGEQAHITWMLDRAVQDQVERFKEDTDASQ